MMAADHLDMKLSVRKRSAARLLSPSSEGIPPQRHQRCVHEGRGHLKGGRSGKKWGQRKHLIFFVSVRGFSDKLISSEVTIS